MSKANEGEKKSGHNNTIQTRTINGVTALPTKILVQFESEVFMTVWKSQCLKATFTS